jgi:hypothetical protein
LFPLHIAEVALRNALDEGLTSAFGNNWHQNQALINLPRSKAKNQKFIEKSIDKSISRINSQNNQINIGQIVANMSFEFWSGILHNDFDLPIWNGRLHNIFPNLSDQEGLSTVTTLALSVKNLRNRVSHHEPIFGADMDLTRRYGEIIQLIRIRNRQTAVWVRDYSRVMGVLREKPAAPGVAPKGGAPARGAAYRRFGIVPHVASLAELITSLRDADKYTLVSGSDGALHVVGPETVYAWMSACAETCGLADLTGTPASELISNDHCLRHRFCDADIGKPEARHLFEQGRANSAPFDVLLLKERDRDGVVGRVVGIVDEASIA